MRRTPSLGWTPCGWSRAQTTVPRRIEKKYLGGTEATRGRGGGGDEATRRIGDEATRRRGDEARELIACFPAPRLVCGGRQTKARRAAGGSTGVAKRRGARSARRDAPGNQLYLGGGKRRNGAARDPRERDAPGAARRQHAVEPVLRRQRVVARLGRRRRRVHRVRAPAVAREVDQQPLAALEPRRRAREEVEPIEESIDHRSTAPRQKRQKRRVRVAPPFVAKRRVIKSNERGWVERRRKLSK